MGQYKITTSDPELFSVAYDAGLGAKNSQGFGMIEKVVDIR
jgi:CRISPR-associated endoribonuclease Cas6